MHTRHFDIQRGDLIQLAFFLRGCTGAADAVGDVTLIQSGDGSEERFLRVCFMACLESSSELGVSHSGPPFVGTLKDLYLEPLKALVEKNGGSVRGDGKPFYLWLDFKDGLLDTQNALATLLAGYPMLTRFERKTAIRIEANDSDVADDTLAEHLVVDRPDKGGSSIHQVECLLLHPSARHRPCHSP